MAISKEEVKKLAELSRISIEDKEVDLLSKDMESILGFVSKLKEVKTEDTEKKDIIFGKPREDENPHKSGLYTEDLIRQAPDKEKGYVKVKKVL